MKRQLISLMFILPLLGLFSNPEVYAQGGTGDLPGTKPTTTTKPAPTPASVRSSRTTPPTPVTPMLNVGEARNGRLDPSDKRADGNLYEEMILLNAKSEDLLSFRIESANPALGLQIIDKNSAAEVPVVKDYSAGDFKISTGTGGVPADGDYRLRVTCSLDCKSAVPFTLKVNRLGLTSIAYVERFDKIYKDYKNSRASVEETVAKLEELGRDNPFRPTAFETLGIIHLEDRKDVGKAEEAMDLAIKANGAAVIQISFDSQWRRIAKLRSGGFGFEDARSGWLKITRGQITVSDLGGKVIGTLSGQQIKELSKTLVGAYAMVTITANNVRRPYVFATKSMQQAETDLVIKLIQDHVMGNSN